MKIFLKSYVLIFLKSLQIYSNENKVNISFVELLSFEFLFRIESVVERNVSLPMFPELTQDQIEYIVDGLKGIIKK